MKTRLSPTPSGIVRLALLLLAPAFQSMSALGDQEGDFVFQTDGTVAVISRYVGPGGAVVIPDQLGGRPVTGIGNYVFGGITSVTNITIPNSVTIFFDGAFRDCTGLTSITIPASVVTITFPEEAFLGCTSLTAIDVDPLNVAFSSMGGVLFNKEQSVLLAYPQGRTGSYAIPNSVTSIKSEAFSGCTGLTSVTIPNSVTGIDGYTFLRCTGLTSITIPSSVTIIVDEAFRGCTGLTNATILDGVTIIARSAFSGCTRLPSVTIPNSVIFIAGDTFYGCTSLTAIHVETLNPAYSSDGGVLFDKTQSVLLTYPPGKAGPYTISSTVTAIRELAFIGCTGLTSIALPDSVTIIEVGAFFDCTGLTSISIPNNVTAIRGDAFSGCTGLTNVSIPNSVTIIEGRAFAGCTGLTSMALPNQLTAIRADVFSGCTGLIGIAIPNSVTVIEGGAFAECTGLKSVTIPNSVTSICAQTFFGCTGLTNVSIPNNVTEIDREAFWGCSSLASVDFGEGVSYIGNRAFHGCIRLGEVIIPNGVTFLGAAFHGCIGLTNVILGNGITMLSYSEFDGLLSGCTNLTSIVIPDSVIIIDSGVFRDCTSLTNVIIGNSVARIEGGAFSGCTSLTRIVIPNSVTLLSVNAFYGCTRLTAIEVQTNNPVYSSMGGVLFNKEQSVLYLCPQGKTGAYVVPNGVTLLSVNAFYFCTGLTSIRIGDGLSVIETAAFQFCTALTSVYLKGNAPTPGSEVFLGSPFVTVFYRPGSTGWGATYQDRPTAVWVPRPAYADWAVTTGLAAQFPAASGEGDDPDGDGFTNRDEWFAGTDPTQPASRLELELTRRPADLSASDQTPIPDGQHAVYFRSVSGRYYGVQRAAQLGGAWELQAVRVAEASQTRFLLPQPDVQAFYRVVVPP